jgi:hypothetical protein
VQLVRILLEGIQVTALKIQLKWLEFLINCDMECRICHAFNLSIVTWNAAIRPYSIIGADEEVHCGYIRRSLVD